MALKPKLVWYKHKWQFHDTSCQICFYVYDIKGMLLTQVNALFIWRALLSSSITDFKSKFPGSGICIRKNSQNIKSLLGF